MREVVAYFDATAARRVRQRVLVAVARHDPVVPPVGQLAVARSRGGPSVPLVQAEGRTEASAAAPEERLRAAAFAAWPA